MKYRRILWYSKFKLISVNGTKLNSYAKLNLWELYFIRNNSIFMKLFIIRQVLNLVAQMMNLG